MTAKKLYSRRKLLTMMDQNETEVNDLMMLFISVVPPMIDNMQNLAKENRWNDAADIAHKLKSSMRLWEMDSLDEDVVFIETHGREGTQLDIVADKLEFLCTSIEKVISEMKEELGI
jgi:HPt (histidine-containing phosphotransfer) domain-containing protein